MLAGFTVAAVEAALGIAALSTGLAPYLFACAAATVALAVGTRRLLVPPPDDGDEPGRGGSPPTGDDPPQPPWWPDFEAAFRAHVRGRERPRQPVH